MKLTVILMILALVNCQAPQGIPGVQGPRGLTGSVGPIGNTGAPGQSITGPAGADGTIIVPVKFCPGAASYPSTFLEYGLCVNGALYAVYSANDGFLALIPDGVYNSNAVGSNCNFTVTGCVISY